MSDKEYKTLKEFYPFYLTEHVNRTNRILHVIGTTLVILFLAYLILTQQFKLLIIAPLIGYGFAWVGHFIFEKNRPATFKYPLYSFLSDFIMWFQVITGQIGLGKKGYRADQKNNA
tara:strand:- start:88474 stop:88821 length:348 start_codon:yes stop_codon:yes gene_type:complete